MTTLETLKAARAKIADRKNWTQGEYARDSHSRRVPVDNPKACRWCSTGALEAVAGDDASEAQSLLSRCVQGTLWHFNDTHTHRQVLAVFDEVISSLEAV